MFSIITPAFLGSLQSLVGYAKVIPYIKFEHWDQSFLVILRTVMWKMHLLTMWPWPVNHKQYHFYGIQR